MLLLLNDMYMSFVDGPPDDPASVVVGTPTVVEGAAEGGGTTVAGIVTTGSVDTPSASPTTVAGAPPHDANTRIPAITGACSCPRPGLCERVVTRPSAISAPQLRPVQAVR